MIIGKQIINILLIANHKLLLSFFQFRKTIFFNLRVGRIKRLILGRHVSPDFFCVLHEVIITFSESQKMHPSVFVVKLHEVAAWKFKLSFDALDWQLLICWSLSKLGPLFPRIYAIPYDPTVLG